LEKQTTSAVKNQIPNCSIYTCLWRVKKHDICKRALLSIAVAELNVEADVIDRLWAKLKDQFGSRDTYPKPYIKMTEADWREL
jgi:hypothetical protein